MVTHSVGYNGTGDNNIIITVGVDPASDVTNLANLRTPILNNIFVWNLQLSNINNLGTLLDDGLFDLESVTLHEMGHALGLAHPNLASESNLSSPEDDATAAFNGTNNVYDVNPGNDAIYGSADDIRGDDVNYFYFNAENNPFVLFTPVDQTTYTSDTANLPNSDLFPSNGGIDVAPIYLSKKRDVQTHSHVHDHKQFKKTIQGEPLVTEIHNKVVCSEVLRERSHFTERARVGTTESVMQQGTFNGETQRLLTADDVAGILYARTGVDEIAGTIDDYSFTLVYAGDSTGNDIDVKMDPTYTGLAVAESNAQGIAQFHYQVTSVFMRVNPNITWFFNPLLASVLVYAENQATSILSTDIMQMTLLFASEGPSTLLTTSDFQYNSTIGGSINVSKVTDSKYTIFISGFTASGTACIASKTAAVDKGFGASYENSNSLCFSVTLVAQITPSDSSTPTVSPSISRSRTIFESVPVSPDPSRSVSKSLTPTPHVSATSSPTLSVTSSTSYSVTATVSPSVTPFPSASVIQLPTDGGESLDYFTTVACNVPAIQCCATFPTNWANLCYFNDYNLVEIIKCDLRGLMIDVQFSQKSSYLHSASEIMSFYYNRARCDYTSISETCYPYPDSLNAATWYDVFILSSLTQITGFSYTTQNGGGGGGGNTAVTQYDFTSFIGTSLLGQGFYQSSTASVLSVSYVMIVALSSLLIVIL